MVKKRPYRIYHCLYCLSKGETKTKAKIKAGDRKIVGLDRPYINLSFHTKCYKRIKNMPAFLNKTKKHWYK